MEELKGLVRDSEGTWAITLRLIRPAETATRRKRLPKRTKAMLLARQDHRCGICGGPISLLDSHVDHVVPRVAGGEDALHNLQLTHPNCNLRKGGRRLVVGQGSMPWA
jgi:5-methylcytosine-specific restriction endonuclease McrA